MHAHANAHSRSDDRCIADGRVLPARSHTYMVTLLMDKSWELDAGSHHCGRVCGLSRQALSSSAMPSVLTVKEGDLLRVKTSSSGSTP